MCGDICKILTECIGIIRTQHPSESNFSQINLLLTADVDAVFQPFNFRMEEIEGFRYRARVGI